MSEHGGPLSPLPSPEGPDLSGLRRLHVDAPEEKPPGNRPNPARIALFLVVAAAVVALPWIVFTQLFRDKGPAHPRASASTSPSPSVTASTANPIAGLYVVDPQGAPCARVRHAAGTAAAIDDCLGKGIKVRADGAFEAKDGFTWLRIQDPLKKRPGWMADKYLKRA